MKRNPRKVRWTKAFRKAHGKEMTIDSTIDFEKRRNVPVRYDRELVRTTITAMKRIGEIKQRREHVFWKQRMAAAREKKRVYRAKKAAKTPSVRLVEPVAMEATQTEKALEKIRIPVKNKSALIQREGRTMDMDID